MEKIKFIDIDDQKVIDLTPNYDRQLALVDMDVLHRLTTLLPKANFSEIRKDLQIKIKIANSIEDLVFACEEFTAFNRSVNLIKEVKLKFGEQMRKESILNEYNKAFNETISCEDLEFVPEKKTKERIDKI